jgi:hypothetical protein
MSCMDISIRESWHCSNGGEIQNKSWEHILELLRKRNRRKEKRLKEEKEWNRRD